MQTMLRRWLWVLLLAAGLALPVATFAASPKGKKVIDLGEMKVEGKILKPEVFYVLGRSEFRYEGLKLERSFVGRIISSARTNPF